MSWAKDMEAIFGSRDDDPVYLVDCTCDHQPDEHNWNHCEVDGCDCEATWEEE